MNNEDVILEYVAKVLKPWKDDQVAYLVLVYDEAKCHITQKMEQTFVSPKILPVLIPDGATSLLQPLDVSESQLT